VNATTGNLPDIEWHDTVGSTNAVAQERFASGLSQPLWIAAGEQTQGRGRLGREWVSKPGGNLYASLLWPVSVPLDVLPSLSLVAGLAVHDAFVATEVARPVQLKWPNDVLLAGCKISGILIETSGAAHGLAAIIGCGLNLAHHPDNTRWPATDLAAHGISIEPTAMLEHLRASMRRRLQQWDGASGLTSIQQDWMAAAMGRGERIRVEGGRHGVFTGLGGNGALEMTLDDGSIWLHHAGDVEWLEAGGNL
jgi:BirA family biotin operon repressor/biotin-[acetyl-CoA-carboxylase] ligase